MHSTPPPTLSNKRGNVKFLHEGEVLTALHKIGEPPNHLLDIAPLLVVGGPQVIFIFFVHDEKFAFIQLLEVGIVIGMVEQHQLADQALGLALGGQLDVHLLQSRAVLHLVLVDFLLLGGLLLKWSG